MGRLPVDAAGTVEGGVAAERAARRLERSRATISRIEEGEEGVRCREVDVRQMLDLYGAGGRDREVLLDITRRANVIVRVLPWPTSRRSGNGGNRVEAATNPLAHTGEILVRDSKNPDAAVLRFTEAEWKAFLGGVHDGEFEV
jgi:hypothetical protein